MLSIKNNLNSNKISNDNVNVCPPPWEVLALVSYHLDPITLAISSCVSKSWFSCFSSDFLWAPLCSSHFPSLSTLQTTVNLPRRRLFAIGCRASRLRRRLPRKPNLSLDNLIFTLTIRIPSDNNSEQSFLMSKPDMQALKYGNYEKSGADWIDQHQSWNPNAGSSHFSKSVKPNNNNNNNNNEYVVNIVRPCKELKRDPQGTFRFEVDVEDDRDYSIDALEGVRVTWNVVDSEAWKAVFTMAEESSAKKGGFSSCGDGWFSEELPTPWCCSGAMSSALVADLRVEMAEGVGGGERKMMRMKKVKVGVMCIINWRYLSVDDALSYLDHFLKV